MKVFFKLMAGWFFFFLTACTTINSSHQTVPAGVQWGIVPFTNNTEVPQAGYRAMSITKGILESNGVQTMNTFKANQTCNQLIVCPNANPSQEQIMTWARHHHLRFVMVGAVNEWVYKVGLDGEPVASVALQLYDVPNGRMIWNSVGSKIGTTRSGLSTTGQQLIREMLCSLKLI